MATLTYNRAGNVLRFDLTDNEVAIVDAVIASPKGSVPIENALNEFFRGFKQRQRDQELSLIRDKIDVLSDAQRQAIMTILTS